jgi:hypothetical protein
VPTHPGYWANRDGRLRGPRAHVLRPMRKVGGHLYVLTHNRRPRTLFVHRAVLLAFMGNPPDPTMECRHLDGDPSNNALINLAWGTRLENCHDKQVHGTERHGEEKPDARLTVTQVIAIREDERSSRIVGRQYGVSHTAILRIRRGERWSAA